MSFDWRDYVYLDFVTLESRPSLSTNFLSWPFGDSALRTKIESWATGNVTKSSYE
jgi:hypothetical protein